MCRLAQGKYLFNDFSPSTSRGYRPCIKSKRRDQVSITSLESNESYGTTISDTQEKVGHKTGQQFSSVFTQEEV